MDDIDRHKRLVSSLEARYLAMAMAIPSLALALLLFLQGCVLLVSANIDPGQLPNALVYIQTFASSASGPPVYLGLDCTTSQVVLYSSSSGPDPTLSKFKFLLSGTSGLDYNIQSVECPSQYVRLDASGGSASGNSNNNGFGQASCSTTLDTSATFRPLPQLQPADAGFYSLQSDAVGYAYLRLDVPNGAVTAQNWIGPYEHLIIDLFPSS